MKTCFITYENHKIYKPLYHGALDAWGFVFFSLKEMFDSFSVTKPILNWKNTSNSFLKNSLNFREIFSSMA